MTIRSYRDLPVWQKAMLLVTECYRHSKSMPANIAQGHGRDDLGENLHDLSVANGSLMALETHLLAAHNAGYVKDNDLASALALTSEVGPMLAGLRKGLKA